MPARVLRCTCSTKETRPCEGDVLMREGNFILAGGTVKKRNSLPAFTERLFIAVGGSCPRVLGSRGADPSANPHPIVGEGPTSETSCVTSALLPRRTGPIEISRVSWLPTGGGTPTLGFSVSDSARPTSLRPSRQQHHCRVEVDCGIHSPRLSERWDRRGEPAKVNQFTRQGQKVLDWFGRDRRGGL
jgi:hypothetical protein